MLKKNRDELLYVQSEEFQKILNAKSRHGVVLQAVRVSSKPPTPPTGLQSIRTVCVWSVSGRVPAAGALL